MQNLKVWEGLAALDRVESRVRAGTYKQPVYSCVQAVEQLPESTPQPILSIGEIKELTAKALFDFDALDKALKELKF